MPTTVQSASSPRTDGSRIPARLRIVAWMLFVVALGLVTMVVSVRSTLMADIAQRANEEVTQEVTELQRFAATGLDPATSKPFTSTTSLVEVFLSRQQFAEHESVVVVNHSTGKAEQLSGEGTPRLDLSLSDPLFTQMIQSPSGAIEYGNGEIRWARVELQPEDPQQHLSFIAISFTGPHVSTLNSTIWLMVGIGAAVLILTGLIGLLVSRQILRPLRTLGEAARSITEQDLTHRLPVHGRDDIATLTSSFNGMLDRLEEAFASQAHFVTRAHHELAEPLAAMDAQLAAAPATRQNLAQRSTIAGLLGVLDDLHTLAQAERRDFVHPHQRVEVLELAGTLQADLEAQAPGRWRPQVLAAGTAALDAQRIRQAVSHLARNALQHGGTGPLQLRVAPTTDGYGRSGLEISVTDDGPGVGTEDVAWLFERFTQVEDAEPQRGAGLGLAIVRAIADAHDGTVFIQSDPGQGATVGIRIPAGPDWSLRRHEEADPAPGAAGIPAGAQPRRAGATACRTAPAAVRPAPSARIPAPPPSARPDPPVPPRPGPGTGGVS
ncbi:HAMP domain-containing histidine kinase [Actinomyces bowdenii]|uniref:sensor histidine kinase n=1 Tax=Actinomyces bowdenii TaxID=131109 RepID=UPI001ABD07F0|nr:HAMP domain-containing sensor histidine kinase [Actinomyces bowdenii]MBO3723640.1 HAMP domain-containing histidine kinase [Actinomyces bowdenii]